MARLKQSVKVMKELRQALYLAWMDVLMHDRGAVLITRDGARHIPLQHILKSQRRKKARK
jgi:hypothetical protein